LFTYLLSSSSPPPPLPPSSPPPPPPPSTPPPLTPPSPPPYNNNNNDDDDDDNPYYNCTPANVLENENFKLYWNRSILTDKTIPFNLPGTTFMNKKTKNIFLIDTAVPNTHNLAKTITNKQNKYQELVNEICAMWKQKAAQLILIAIPSTAVIPKSLSQSLTRLNLHPNTYIYNYKNL